MTVVAFVFAVLGEQLREDIPFLLLLVVLVRLRVITITFPEWLVTFFEAQDLAALPESTWRIQ